MLAIKLNLPFDICIISVKQNQLKLSKNQTSLQLRKEVEQRRRISFYFGINQMAIPFQQLSKLQLLITNESQKPSITGRQFYEKPYATCKGCINSKFKCKSCLDNLVVKLRQLRKQHSQPHTDRKRKYSEMKMPTLHLPTQHLGKSPKELITSEMIYEQQRKLADMKFVVNPVLHQTIIEVPQVVPEKSEHWHSTSIFRHDYRKLNSIANVNSITEDIKYEQYPKSKLSVHTLEVPAIEKQTLLLRADQKIRIIKSKVNQSKERLKLQDSEENMLPAIRQLSIEERDFSKKRRSIVVSKPSRRKIQMKQRKTQIPHQVPKQRPTPSYLIPVSAWDHHDKHHHYDFDIYS